MDAQTCMNQCSQATEKECCASCVFINVEGDDQQISPKKCTPSIAVLGEGIFGNGGW